MVYIVRSWFNSSMIVVGAPVGTSNSLAIVSQFNQKVVSYSHNVHATIAPMIMSYQTRHYCSFQSSNLGVIGGYFYLSVVI